MPPLIAAATRSGIVALLEPPGPVVDDAGVRVDVAGEAEPRAQQVGDDGVRERKSGLVESHALVRHVHRHAVVGHDRRHAGVDGRDERFQVIGEAAARIDLALAERVVGIEPHLLRPTAGKVLDGERDRGRRAHPPTLQARHQRAHDARVEIGVLGERLVDAIPARLGGEVGRVAVHPAQPDGAPLGAHHRGQRVDRRHRAEPERRRRDAGLLRELGERAGAGRDAEARVGLVMIAGVVLEHDRDAQPLPLGERLDGVGEIGHLPRRDGDTAKRRRRGGVAGIAFRPDDVAQHEAAHLLRLDERGRGRRQRTAAAGVQRVDQHEPGLLLERQAADQVADARLDGAPPVLVRIELAAAVGVLEAQAVDREHGAAAHANGRLRRGGRLRRRQLPTANPQRPRPARQAPPRRERHEQAGSAGDRHRHGRMVAPASRRSGQSSAGGVST